MKFLSLLFTIYFLTCTVFGDQIIIYGPPEKSIYHPKDIMDIRYKVKAIGMTKLWAAYAFLKHDSSNKTISGFPVSPWKESIQGRKSVHTIWIIPEDIVPGTYTLAVSGNSTYPCSKAGNGTAPFKRCNSSLSAQRTFTIVPRNSTVQ